MYKNIADYLQEKILIDMTKIELKNVKIADKLSEETIAFTADIYVDGVKTGYAKNGGHGGNTDYNAYEGKRELLAKAEAYCLSLPPVKNEEHLNQFGMFEYPMNLEHYIDDAVAKFDLDKKMGKDFAKGVCYGKVGGDYQMRFYTKNPIATLLQSEAGRNALKKLVKDVQSNLKTGESILNTNIPAEILAA